MTVVPPFYGGGQVQQARVQRSVAVHASVRALLLRSGSRSELMRAGSSRRSRSSKRNSVGMCFLSGVTGAAQQLSLHVYVQQVTVQNRVWPQFWD